MNEELFFIIPAVLIILITIGSVLWRSKQISSTMEEFAQQHSLQFHAPPMMFLSYPSMDGIIRGFSVNIFLVKKGSGKSSKLYTVLDVTLPQVRPFQFHIYEAGLLSGLGKAFGMQDIEIGDEAFDKKFIIKSSDPVQMTTMLTPSVREMFTNAANQYSSWGVEFNGTKLTYQRQGAFVSSRIVSEFEAMINLFCDLGEQMKSQR